MALLNRFPTCFSDGVVEGALPMKLFKSIRGRFRCWRYREGRKLSRFIARDIRREILIDSAAKVDVGIITGRVRTMNVLYVARGLVPEPEFEPARELRICEMWRWTGQSWGGLPDGTSFANRCTAMSPNAKRGATADGRGR